MLKNIVIGIVLLVVGYYAYVWIFYPTYKHRYRITMEFNVDGKIHRGSGVLESYGGQKPSLLGLPEARRGINGVRGEAIPVNLGETGQAFAILAHGPLGTETYNLDRLSIDVFNPPKCDEPYCQWREITQMSGKRELDPLLIPTLVRFRDVKDPTTAEVIYATDVDSTARHPLPRMVVVDRLDEVFGGKVKLHKAWIELTTDPVTRGIEKKLPWFGKPLPWLKRVSSKIYVDDRKLPPGAYRLNASQFKIGG